MKPNTIHHRIFSATASFALALLLTATSAHAVLQVNYIGDQLATSPWAPSSAAYSVGVGTITFGNGTTGPWDEMSSSAPGSLWQPSGTGGKVEIDFAINTASAGGYDTGLYISQGSRSWTFLIATGVINLNGVLDFRTLNLNQSYKLTADYTGNSMNVSLDGVAIANLQNIAGAATSDNVIYLHRFTGSVGADAVATYSNVAWDNAVVPEPGTYALLIFGGAVIGISVMKRRRGAVV